MKKILKYGVIAILGIGLIVFLAIQAVPYGHDHTNPPIVSEPNWNTPQTRQLVKDRCFQCHSNETSWPWYSNVAPASWLLAYDVAEGREKFNFSDWQNHPTELSELIENIQSGEMPPLQYVLFHPDSRLTDPQKQEMIAGFQASGIK